MQSDGTAARGAGGATARKSTLPALNEHLDHLEVELEALVRNLEHEGDELAGTLREVRGEVQEEEPAPAADANPEPMAPAAPLPRAFYHTRKAGALLDEARSEMARIRELRLEFDGLLLGHDRPEAEVAHG